MRQVVYIAEGMMKNQCPNPGKVQAAQEVIAHGLQTYSPRLVIACSFSLEDTILLHMAVAIEPQVPVFALDTGRLPPETYICADEIQKKFNIPIQWFFPDTQKVESLVREQGVFSFRESVAARKACCEVRKVEPLARALQGYEAWITGLRREQSCTRTRLEVVESDPQTPGRIKMNPLATWTLAEVWAYIKSENLPYNRLYTQGYLSIGCAPCSRAVKEGESERAGRWWWESEAQKECGLHQRNTLAT